MRIMPFVRRFDGETDVSEYIVIGANDRKTNWSDDDTTSSECSPIQMTINKCKVLGQPCNTGNMEAFINAVDSDMFKGGYYEQGGYTDFRENYADIIRGHRHDWLLSAFRVSVGIITLYFVNPQTLNSGFLWITEAQCLDITFQTSRTRLGFSPVYDIHISHSGKKHNCTRIKEDLGYIRYEGELKLIDPHKKDDDFLHHGNQIYVGVEYAGI